MPATGLDNSAAGKASPHAVHWTLDPAVAFLNHGSFGACPAAVLAYQAQVRARLERQPVRFIARELEGLLDEARAEAAAFVGADADDFAFVPNATSGVNAVVRSLRFEPGDELLTTDHAYNACRNVLAWAEGQGARVVTVRVPFPIASADELVEPLLARASAKTKLALVDHITSPTALVFPVERIVRELAARGVDTLVDGAHAPGNVPLDVRAIGAAYYTGNFHKWVCAPKGAAFLHVRRDRQAGLRPIIISHGANSPRRDRSRFRLEFDWCGTMDPSPYLSVPVALRFMAAILPGGWAEVMAKNRALALEARKQLGRAIGVDEPAPAEMIGSMATLPLPDEPLSAVEPPSDNGLDPLHKALLARGFELPMWHFPAAPRRILRVSAQLYNAPAQYELLAAALRELLQR